MIYKVVKNQAGEVVAFGPNDENYEPTIKAGEVLTFSNEIPNYVDVYGRDRIIARQAVLDKLGLTADEAAALFG